MPNDPKPEVVADANGRIADVNVTSGESQGESELEVLLGRIQQASQALDTYQCELDYIYTQPLLDSSTRRRGAVYYVQQDTTQSMLRIRFDTIQEDEGDRETYREDMTFDGVWWTHLDYRRRSMQKRQLADANAPMHAMDLAGQSVPIIGFQGVERLRKEFVISLPETDESVEDAVKLRLVPKGDPASADYQLVEVWVDKASHLPVQVQAQNINEEIYTLRFLASKVNQPLVDAVFEINVPPGFGEPEIIPLSPHRQ
ncbi:outer membrane lipoprotein carrier protein LolA [Planctomycetota bacterium]